MVQRFKWELEEILAILHLGFKYEWASMPGEDDCKRLSEVLRKRNLHALNPLDDKYRNLAGVKRKYQDLLSTRPGYPGKPTNGGKLTSEVAEFSVRDPAVAAVVGEAVWKSLMRP